jgi:hypothetical protein
MSELEHILGEVLQRAVDRDMTFPVIACGISPNGSVLAVRIGSDGGAVAGLVGIEDGVVSGVINLESSGVEAPDWRPRHDKQYHEA